MLNISYIYYAYRFRAIVKSKSHKWGTICIFISGYSVNLTMSSLVLVSRGLATVSIVSLQKR